MKKYKYVILFFVLIILGLIYYFTYSKNTLKSEFNIALKSADKIDEISFLSKGDTLSFVKENKDWIVNNGAKASGRRMHGLFAVLTSLSVNNPVTGENGNIAKKDILKNGVLVKCKIAGKTVYNIYLSVNPKDLNGNFAFVPYHKYLVRLRPLPGNLNFGEFITMNPKFWHNKDLFTIKSKNIVSIGITWSEDEHFEIIKKKDNSYSLSINGEERVNASSDKLKYYTYEFENIQMNRKGDKYKQLAGSLLCEINVVTEKGRSLMAQFFEYKSDASGLNKNRLIVCIKNSDSWGEISYIKMSHILKHAEFFDKE